MFDINKIRADFPILGRKYSGKNLAYLDNAATSQKPQQVLKAIENYYTQHNANIKRSVHFLAEEATNMYEAARTAVANFVNAKHAHEIILTRNATEAINLVAHSYGRSFLKKGDEIVLTKMEHHSNIVPWLMLAKEKELTLKYIDVDKNGELMLDELEKIITEKTKLVGCVYVSNTLGTINPVKKIAKRAHEVGAKILLDAAQAAPHLPINVQELDCDFLAITGHKMLAPTGIGALYIKEELAQNMPPFLGGGEMIQEVFLDHFTPAQLPEKFEAGTPNISGAIGLHAAIEYIQKIGFKNIQTHEEELTEYLLEQLQTLPGLNIIGKKTAENRIGSVSFTVDGIHPHDVSEILSSEGVCTRAGHHCTQPLMDHFKIPATTRASLYFYNTKEEIDQLIAGLKKVQKIFA